MKRFFLWFIYLCCYTLLYSAQPVHVISGTVIDKVSREPIDYVNVAIIGFERGCVTDSVGRFAFENIGPGAYTLKASAIGRKGALTSEYIVSTRNIDVTIEMESSPAELATVNVVGAPFRRDADSPIGLRIIGIQEIEKSPGANRDISKIVQSYPGVSFSPAGYRNDLIVRGGAPSENRFYLDGIEIPNINHFSTEGASGGPVGIINADLIREVKFYTGAFPANRGNALSSVLDFKLRDGGLDHNSLKATVGASDFSLASTGHLGKKTTYLVSVRQSYLQLLFKMIGLPFLPTFTDAQFKIKTTFDRNNELTILGVGGIDNMKLNTSLTDEKSEYLLSYLPKIKQETFTLGASYKHYAGINSQTVVLSHSYLNNRNTKYHNNDESLEENLMLKLNSREQETKLRVENTSLFGQWKLNVGANVEYAQYENNSFQRMFSKEASTLQYDTSLDMIKWGIFATTNYVSSNDRFTASLGLRTDACDYSDVMKNMLKQLSPRLSLSYRVAGDLYASGNAGMYYQLPPYTGLGYKDNAGVFVNKDLKYMRVIQSSVGMNWHKGSALELSAEVFYKNYDKIPLSVTDNIPLACKGDDYGVIGNELLISVAQGRSYGVELLARWFIAQRLNMSSSFTLFKSEYRNNSESSYIPSAWDSKFIFNVSGTYSFPSNWSVGMKVKCIGGAPYTPYDVEKSSLVTAWNAQGRPYYDYTRYNSERLPVYGQLDLRVDKIFYIKRCMLGFYIDLQNVTVSKFRRQDVLMSTGIIENPTAPIEQQRYKMKNIKQDSGSLIPSLGITFEY
ncbi:MAG: TonB-dependent receptor [Muribaculaceae bacterium]